MLKVRPLLELYFFASLGAGFALAIDFLSANGRAILNVLSVLVSSLFNTTVPGWVLLYSWGAIMVGVGTASVLYFKPLSLKGAFASGFCTIAIIAIFFP